LNSSPKNKYIRITKDENFSHDKNYLSNTPAIADSVCSYDLDQLDEAWLKEFNGERGICGLPPVNEEQFERIIEELEVCSMSQSYDMLILKKKFLSPDTMS
jgi:Enhancer of polycomb-like